MNIAPTLMSLFSTETTLASSSHVIVLIKDSNDNWVNAKVPMSSASYEFGKSRWIVPEVTSPTDPRGSTGDESFDSMGNHWIKSGSLWLNVSQTSASLSSSYAITSSHAIYSIVSKNAYSASYILPGVIVPSSSYSTFSVNSITSQTASYVSYVDTANTSQTASFSFNSATSSYLWGIANSSSYASRSKFSETASYVQTYHQITSSMVYVSVAPSGSRYSRLIKDTPTTIVDAVNETRWIDAEVVNVKDFGAKGDGVTNDTTAVSSALASISSKGTLYFPDGTYYLTSNSLNIHNKDVLFKGEGPSSTILKLYSLQGQLAIFSSSFGGLKNLRLDTNNSNRDKFTPIVKFVNCTEAIIHNVHSYGSGGTFSAEGGNWLFMDNVFVRPFSHGVGGLSLKTTGQGLTLSNTFLSNDNSCPNIWIRGTATSIKVNNSSFSGGGPLWEYPSASISSTSNTFTINLGDTNHFGINEYVIITGSSSQYCGYWRVAATGSTSVIISSSLNLGNYTPTLVTSIPCTAVIDNETGAVNESIFSNTMFEAVGYPSGALSTGLYIDGTKSDHNISGWTLNSCYFDYGKIGGLIIGGGTTGYNTTVGRINFCNSQVESYYRLFSIEQTSGIVINGLQGSMYQQPYSSGSGIYIYSNPNGSCNNILISNANVGGDVLWQNRGLHNPELETYPYGLNVFDNGLTINGNVKGLSILNSLVGGINNSVYVVGTSITGSIIKSSGNTFFTGSSIPTNDVIIPSISSNSTITIPWNDQINLTGTTTVTTINGGWLGREVMFVIPSGLTFNTGGNISTSKTISAGTICRLMFDGSFWRHVS